MKRIALLGFVLLGTTVLSRAASVYADRIDDSKQLTLAGRSSVRAPMESPHTRLTPDRKAAARNRDQNIANVILYLDCMRVGANSRTR